MTTPTIQAADTPIGADAAVADQAEAAVEAVETQATLLERLVAIEWQENLTGIGLAVLATVALVLLLRGIGLAFERIYRFIRERGADRLPSIRIQSLVLVPKDKIVATFLIAARIVRGLITLLLVYIYIPLVLSFFPPTRPLANTWLRYVADPIRVVANAILGYLPNLFFIAVIALATYYVLRLLRLVFLGIETGRVKFRGFYPEWSEPTYKILRLFVLALAVVVVWPYLPNSDSTAFKGVAAFLGLLFSLGAASSVANIVGGMMLVYMRPFQVGDWVRIADTVGDVTERTLLVTRLRTPKNVEVTIPNAMVVGTHMINYANSAREGKLILHTSLTIGYDVDWRRVHAALVAAAADTERIEAEPEPFVLQRALNDHNVEYQLNAYTGVAREMYRTYSELHQNIQDRFRDADIEILSPLYAAVRDGNEITIPARVEAGVGAGESSGDGPEPA